MQDKSYQEDIEVVLKKNNSSKEGLSEKEVTKRLEAYGLNKLDEQKKKSDLTKFFEQFTDLMVIILIIAAIISMGISYVEGESFFESIIILSIVVINAFLGFFQEKKADDAIAALKNMAVTDIKVRRDNEIKVINVENIVVGDILVLEAGDYVPADARIFYSASLKVEEASLTGESGSVDKNSLVIDDDTILADRHNMVFSGSSVVYGKCEAIVTKTGMDTELGKIAKTLSEEVTEETPLQKKIDNISKILSLIVGFIVVIILIIGLINGMSLMHVFIIAVSLAVAAIPEGLPTVITVILSLGMTKLAKDNAVVRKVSSVETLGSTEIICSDKTGTITKNEMTVRKFYFDQKILKHVDDLRFNQVMFLCNDVSKSKREYIGDPTEIALYKYSEKKKFDYDLERVFEFPFDSDRKLMSTIFEEKKENVVFVKGSAEMLLSKCTSYIVNGKEIKITKAHINEIKKNEELLSDEALRVLGIAYKKIDKKKEYTIEETEADLVFIGLVGMIDPPRESVKASILKCKEAGITPVMITGDNLNTAIAIASEVGIYNEGDFAIEGRDLDNISDRELQKTVHKYKVYARVTPEHKLRIVKAWRKNKKVVSMTGDGVNDAPALKASDVGVGMGITGTEVTKNVADIVLLDDSFSTIIVAVEEGRNIYENIRKAISYLITANIAEVIIVFFAMITDVTILLPIHLLYINLVTDAFPAIALSFEPNDKDIMSKPVRKNTDSLFTPFLTANIAFSSVFKSIVVLALFFTSSAYFGEEVAMTMAFLGLILIELTFAFNSRNLFKGVVNKELFSNKIMNISFVSLIALQLILFNTPLRELFELEKIGINEVGFILIFVIGRFIVNELAKPILRKCFKDE